MWFCLFFLFFPLAEGGRRSCSWRSAAAGEGRERRAKASAGRPLVVEIDGEKEATSKRGEWSAPRRKKKERQKTEETKTGKKNVSLSLTPPVTTQSFFQLSSLPFLDLLLLAAGTQKPQEVSTRPALRSGGAARDGRGAKWRIPGGRGGASCRLKIGCSGFKRANCFSLASAAAQPPEGIAPPPPLACRLGSQHSTEAFAQAPLWPLRACRELRRLARRSARSDVRAAPGGAPSFPRDAHTNFEHSLLFFTSFTGAEPQSNQPIMPVTTSTVGEY